MSFPTRNTFCQTRSLSNATFSFLITWRSSSSKSAAVYKISWKSDEFSLRYGDNRFSKWRPFAILELFYHHTRPPTKSVKFYVNLTHRSEDIAIWIFRIYLAWNAYSCPQNRGSDGLWSTKCDYSPSRPPKGELTESITDTHRQTHPDTHTHR